MSKHPEVLWAQRSSESVKEKNILYITINLPDLADNYTLDVQANRLTFSDSKKVTKTSRSVNLVLQKAELNEEYWPRLTKEKRINFVKTDFSKWVDEDEQDAVGAEAEDPMGGMDMASMMGGMGGGAGGMDMASMMQGMGGAGGSPDMEALMAQMGGMAGGAGAGQPDEGDSSDEDLPALDEAGSSADKGKGKATE